MKTTLLTFGCLTALLTASYSMAGDERGNGSDTHAPEYESAWFLGETNTIHYCIEASPKFGTPTSYEPNDTPEKTIERAFEIWNYYIAPYNSARTSNLRIATKAVKLERCTGGQDLTFYLGLDNSEVHQQRSRYDNPVAFAARTQYDLSKGWGKGFVWVAAQGELEPQAPFPNWTTACSFQGIILHELGHVLGSGHIPGTIMRDDIGDFIRGAHCHALGQINFDRELVFTAGRNYTYQADFGASYDADPQGTGKAQAYLRLTGKMLGQGTWPTATLSENPTDSILAHFSVRDSGVESPFDVLKISDPSSVSMNYGPATALKAVIKDPALGVQSTGYPDLSIVEYGSLKTMTGDTLNIIVERNTQSAGTEGPVVIKYFDEGKILTLVRAKGFSR